MRSSPTWLLVVERLSWGIIILCIAALALTNCASVPVEDPIHALAGQILVPRAGYTGLTEGAYRAGKLAVTEYKFEDAEFRDTANRLHFICRMGKKRYMICKDQPGLCRVFYDVKKKCLIGSLGCHEVDGAQHIEYLPASGYKLFLDSNLVCYSEDKYDLQGW